MAVNVGGWSTPKHHTLKPYPILPPVLAHGNVYYMGLTFANLRVH